MRIEELDYHLPEELIAQEPISPRDHSRLLVVHRDAQKFEDRFFYNLPEYLKPGDVLVVNDTRVIPARIFFRKPTGGRVEGLFIRELAENSWEVMIKGISKLKPNTKLRLKGVDIDFVYEGKLSEKTAKIKLTEKVNTLEILKKVGHVPLPPYIKRNYLRDEDRRRKDFNHYQTVFSQTPGAIAAPTAGLHFTEDLLNKIKSMDVKVVTLTLHVGQGTFEPITAENIQDHKIHTEYYSIPPESAEIINQAKSSSHRIIAVGTTSVRVLESVTYDKNKIKSSSGLTNLYIYPPYEFRIVDALITNFHLPRSTLLALVYAFGGIELIKRAYTHAVRKKYRFFSYGDAMIIL